MTPAAPWRGCGVLLRRVPQLCPQAVETVVLLALEADQLVGGRHEVIRVRHEHGDDPVIGQPARPHQLAGHDLLQLLHPAVLVDRRAPHPLPASPRRRAHPPPPPLTPLLPLPPCPFPPP